ncbi:MAG: OmpA family protein [Flavobacteriales bacterium]|nr:OmpA family protein [Flavobacteriales bacterium]
MRLVLILFVLSANLCLAQKQHKQSFFFETGSDQLTATQIQRISVLQKRISQSQFELYLYGFTDQNGSNSSNLGLAKRRVSTIADLIGAKSYRISREEYLGEDSLTHVSDSMNRRVDIVILDYKEFYEKKSMKLKGCHFVPGEYEFLDEKAEDAVKRLAVILKENPEFNIMIEGHVCCGPDQTLSNNRAIRVFNYLVDLKIDKDRLNWKGFSNSRPRVKEYNDKMMTLNRRVEVRLVD